MRKSLSFVMVLLFSLFLMGGVHADAGGPKVPPFELLSLDGKKYTDKDLLDKPTLLIFWASWCGTCQHELPKVRDLTEKMKGKSFQVIAIGFKDSEANIRGYVKSHPDVFNFPVLYDPNDRISTRFGAQFTPTLFLLNKKGERVLHHFSGGFFERREFQEALQQLLKRGITKLDCQTEMDFHYDYITTPDAFREAIDALRGAPIIGVDTEGDSLYSYQERVSLIQISGAERHFIFDPLLLETVEPLGALLEERSILKIFHGADYDLVSLKRDFGFNIGPIFDTALAARALGVREFSLQNLIARYFQLNLSKTHQKSNWSIRPLPKDQLDYAAQDTAYLVPLYELLKKEIAEKGRMDQIEEECRLLEAITWSGKTFEPDDYLRIKGARVLPAASQKILRELAVVRNQLAKKRNRPPFKIISNDDLIKMAKESPRSEEDLKRLFPRETAPVFRNPALWLNAVAKGLTTTDPLPKVERNGSAPLTPEQERLLTRLKEWRNKQAEQEGVEPAMVVTSGVLRDIAKRTPKSIEALREVASLREWQIHRYGELLIKEIFTPPKARKE